jgi:hypothetical protein
MRFLLLAALFSGCTGGLLIQRAIDRDDNLTPAQIRQYRESGQNVYGCFSLSGPPAGGSTLWIIAPADAEVDLKWLDGCRLLPFVTRP